MKRSHQSSPNIFVAENAGGSVTPQLLAAGAEFYNQCSDLPIPLPPVDWQSVLNHSRSCSTEEAERQIAICDIFVFPVAWGGSRFGATVETLEQMPHEHFQQAIRRFRETGAPQIYLFWGHSDNRGPPFDLAVFRSLHTEDVRFQNILRYLLEKNESTIDRAASTSLISRIQTLADAAKKIDRQMGPPAEKWAKLERAIFSVMWKCERPAGLKWRIPAYGNLAKIFFDLSQPFRTKMGHRYLYAAAAFYRRSLVISESLGDREGVAMSYSGLGCVAHHMTKLDESETYHKKALAIHTSLNQPELMARNYDRLGYVYRCKEESDEESAEMFFKALAIWRKLGNESKIAWSLSNAARALYYSQRYPEARDLVWEAVPLHEKLGDVSGVAWGLYFSGLICWQEQDFKTAREYLDRSLKNFILCKNDSMEKRVREHIEDLSS